MRSSAMRTHVFSFLVVSALVVAVTLPVRAAEPSSRELNSGWQFRIATAAATAPAQGELKEWHAATVPGVVQTDLLANKLIPDPFYQDNESRLQWIGESDWEYQTSFQVDEATLGHPHVELVFEGLDTFADVYMNEHQILQTDNMFRRFRLAVKSMLRPG